MEEPARHARATIAQVLADALDAEPVETSQLSAWVESQTTPFPWDGLAHAVDVPRVRSEVAGYERERRDWERKLDDAAFGVAELLDSAPYRATELTVLGAGGDRLEGMLAEALDHLAIVAGGLWATPAGRVLGLDLYTDPKRLPAVLVGGLPAGVGPAAFKVLRAAVKLPDPLAKVAALFAPATARAGRAGAARTAELLTALGEDIRVAPDGRIEARLTPVVRPAPPRRPAAHPDFAAVLKERGLVGNVGAALGLLRELANLGVGVTKWSAASDSKRVAKMLAVGGAAADATKAWLDLLGRDKHWARPWLSVAAGAATLLDDGQDALRSLADGDRARAAALGAKAAAGGVSIGVYMLATLVLPEAVPWLLLSGALLTAGGTYVDFVTRRTPLQRFAGGCFLSRGEKPFRPEPGELARQLAELTRVLCHFVATGSAEVGTADPVLHITPGLLPPGARFEVVFVVRRWGAEEVVRLAFAPHGPPADRRVDVRPNRMGAIDELQVRPGGDRLYWPLATGYRAFVRLGLTGGGADYLPPAGSDGQPRWVQVEVAIGGGKRVTSWETDARGDSPAESP